MAIGPGRTTSYYTGNNINEAFFAVSKCPFDLLAAVDGCRGDHIAGAR
jgi:hypothetical protein